MFTMVYSWLFGNPVACVFVTAQLDIHHVYFALHPRHTHQMGANASQRLLQYFAHIISVFMQVWMIHCGRIITLAGLCPSVNSGLTCSLMSWSCCCSFCTSALTLVLSLSLCRAGMFPLAEHNRTTQSQVEV